MVLLICIFYKLSTFKIFVLIFCICNIFNSQSPSIRLYCSFMCLFFTMQLVWTSMQTRLTLSSQRSAHLFLWSATMPNCLLYLCIYFGLFGLIFVSFLRQFQLCIQGQSVSCDPSALAFSSCGITDFCHSVQLISGILMGFIQAILVP